MLNAVTSPNIQTWLQNPSELNDSKLNVFSTNPKAYTQSMCSHSK